MPIHRSFPDNTLSLIVNNISNYYDLLHLKRTNRQNYSLIQNEAPFLPKIAEVYPSGFKYRLSMNVRDITYEEEQQELMGRSLAKSTYTTVPKSPSFEEMNYVKFCFSSPNVRGKMINLTLLLNVANYTINITYGSKKIAFQVTPIEMKKNIRKLISLYHKAKVPGNMLFVVLTVEEFLEIIVTNDKLKTLSCLLI